MEKLEFDRHIEALEESAMFYMSLGSKELFHTNFLHWLSIVDSKYFIEVLHGLAGTSKFWWEDCPFEVRREDKNFDLSIWLLINKKQDKEIWIPVLIIENKMKSLPYREQLEEYVDKAFDIWWKAKGNAEIKDVINSPSHTPKGFDITLIVLSLLSPTNLETNIQKTVSCNKYNLNINYNFSWKCKNYQDLHAELSKKQLSDSFFQNILNDYCKFILNLYQIAEGDWCINLNNINNKYYIDEICPKMSRIQDVKDKIEKLEQLRIADIREKICYDQLLNKLVEKLGGNAQICQKNQNAAPGKLAPGKFYCRTGYYHKIGLFEVYFYPKGYNSNFYLSIQVQGNKYTHAISGTNIVAKVGKQNQLTSAWSNNAKWINDIDFFFNFSGSQNNIFPSNITQNTQNTIYRYGSTFMYKCADIPQKMSIDDVLNCVVNDVNNIMSQGKKLGWI